MGPIIDTNVNLSRWPFRRLKGDEPAELVAKLRQHEVVQAWAGSFDGLLHRDIAAVNSRLTEECGKHAGLLVPFGTVNPTIPDWEEDLRRCHEHHKMPGIRLHPNYHGYKLDDPLFSKLLGLASERGLVVQLVLSMEDERTQHPGFRVPIVDARPLDEIVKKLPKLRLVLLNAFRALRADQAPRLASAGQIYFDIAMLEGATGIAKLIEQVDASRILFGSHFPFYYFESALLKVRESALAEPIRKSICESNARRLMAK